MNAHRLTEAFRAKTRDGCRRDRYKFVVRTALLVGVLLASCTRTEDGLRAQGAADANCDEKKMSLESTGRDQYAVRGCGWDLRYRRRCKIAGSYGARKCSWHLTDRIQLEEPPTPEAGPPAPTSPAEKPTPPADSSVQAPEAGPERRDAGPEAAAESIDAALPLEDGSADGATARR